MYQLILNNDIARAKEMSEKAPKKDQTSKYSFWDEYTGKTSG